MPLPYGPPRAPLGGARPVPAALIALLGVACAGPAGWTEAERATIASLSPVPAPALSPTNRVADDPAAARLGEALFFDEGLSIDGQTSCASCHLPDKHFTDGERVATAIGTGTRNTPSIETVAWGTPNCGKGQPSQSMHVGHGAAPIRVRGVQIGVMR